MTEKQMDRDDRRGLLIGGGITLGVGVVFLLSNLRIIPDFSEVWPLIPIIVGLALIAGAFKKSGKSTGETNK